MAETRNLRTSRMSAALVKSKLVRWSPWVLAAILAAVGPAAGAPKQAERGVATFVHGAEHVAPGGTLPLVLVVYGFTQLTEAAPLPAAKVELAWDSTNVDPAEVATLQKPVLASTDSQGAALVSVTAPHGPGPWTLLVRTQFEDKERTDEIQIERADAESVRLSRSVDRARAGDSVHAWVEVARGMLPAAATRVRFDVLEGDVAVETVWAQTDAAGRADTELRLPKSDALLTGWTLAATTERGSTGRASLPLKDDTPTEASLEYEPTATPPKPGGALTVVGQLKDATGNPVQNTEVETWNGPANLEVDSNTDKWKKLAQKTRTDSSGRFRVQATMPTVIGRSGVTWLTRAVATIGGERISGDHKATVGRSTHHVRLLQPAGGVVPGFRGDLLLVADDGEDKPVPNVEFRLEGDGLKQTVRTNERGEAVVDWNVPLGVGTTRHVEPCSGGVAANLAIVSEPSAVTAGFPARSDLCIPVDRESRVRVVVDPPVVRAGEPVRITLQESQPGKVAVLSTRTFSLVARGEDGEASATRTALTKAGAASIATSGLEAGSYTLSALGVSGRAADKKQAEAASKPALGHFLVVPARMPRPSATLRSRDHLPNGHASIDVKLIDDKGTPFVGTVGAIVTERRFDSQAGAVAMDVRNRYCADDGHHALRCDDAVVPSSPRQKSAPAYLAETTGRALAARHDPMHSARSDADKTFAEVVRSLEGAIFEASGSRDTLQDVLRKVGGKNGFNPELLTLAVQAMPEPPLTPGGVPVALVDLVSLDPQVDYDHVARRVARYKLFKVLEALRSARQDKDPIDVSFDDPNAALRRLLAASTLEEGALIDPWGGTMAFVRGGSNAQSFLSPKRGFELHAPGPDGRLGTADDVKSPFERVLRSGTPYAIATDEDKVVDAQFDLQIAQSSVDAWSNTLQEATGTALGGVSDLGGGRGEGIGLGGSGSGGGGMGIRQGRTRVSGGTGFRALLAPRAIGADGSVRLEVPLGADEGVYRVLLVFDVPGLGRLVEVVDVPVELKRSLRIKTADRWVVGDQGDLSVLVENRDDTPAQLEVVAEASSSNVAFGAQKVLPISVPAHGRRNVALQVGTPRAGVARVRVALRERGRIVDRYEGTWKVVPAGEPVMLAEAAWVRSESTIPRPSAAGHVANGAQTLTLQANGNDVLRAALMAVEPARLRERHQAENARLLALAVHHYADAQDDKKLGTLATAVEQRAVGRATILPEVVVDTKNAASREGCPTIPLERLFRDDPAGLEPNAASATGKNKKPKTTTPNLFGTFSATTQCFDQQINQRVEDLLAKGETVDLARAILELAEHEPREPLAVALTLELRKRVKLTSSGRMTPPERQNHIARTLVFSALLRSAHTVTSTSKIDAAALVPWLLVEQDAYGSFGSIEATTAAVRALVASGAMSHTGKTVVEIETSAGKRQVAVPPSGIVQVALPNDDQPVSISVHGTPVLARVLAPTLRTFKNPPLPAASAPEVRVDWPEDARPEQDVRLSVRVAPRSSNVTAELRIPLPANVELVQKPQNGARLIDHVLRIPVPKVGLATQLTVRAMHRGRFTAPEGGLYEGGERQSVVPAATLVSR